MSPLDILVVDDEQSICLLLHDVLASMGHRVATCQDGASALELASEQSFDLILLDIRMPGMNGMEALKSLREVRPEATYVMITGYARDDVVGECLRTGASACLSKPFSIHQVTDLLEKITEGRPLSA